MKRVYLCGPINGCTDEECKDWREEAKKKLSAHGYECIDPMRRDYRGVECDNVAEIVESDITDIDNSDVILVNAPNASWGTAMEVFYAYRSGKTVVMVIPYHSKISPWQRYHSNIIVCTFDAAFTYIVKRVV